MSFILFRRLQLKKDFLKGKNKNKIKIKNEKINNNNNKINKRGTYAMDNDQHRLLK